MVFCYGNLSRHCLLWVKLCPPKHYVKVLTLGPQNGTLFRNRVDEDVISQNEVTVECAPNPMTGVLIKGKSDTHTGKRPCKDWSDTLTAEDSQKPGEPGTGPSPARVEGARPCQHVHLTLLASRTGTE